jgi:hypothetical protein
VSDVLIGSATANRTLPGTDEVIGFFVNGRLTRVRLAPSVTLAELTGQVGESWRATDAHDQAHLEKTIVDLGVPDMVNVKFSHNEIPTLPDPLPTFGGAPPRRVGLGQASTSRRQVSVALAPDGHRLTGALTYRTDVLDPAVAAGSSRSLTSYCAGRRIAADGKEVGCACARSGGGIGNTATAVDAAPAQTPGAGGQPAGAELGAGSPGHRQGDRPGGRHRVTQPD